MSEEKPKLGGIKHDTDKVDFALVPVHSLTEVARVWTFGKKKYSAWNWKGGFIWSRPYAAALRHIYAWARGEDIDPETGLPHLAHAICCLQMLIEFGHTGSGEDDRQKEAKPLPTGFETKVSQHSEPGLFSGMAAEDYAKLAELIRERPERKSQAHHCLPEILPNAVIKNGFFTRTLNKGQK